uniref:Uncharacterized protein n=1 Tax=Rhizophora mucronata TaxID=61149 RepID=A0A2P2NJS2_RHIMU
MQESKWNCKLATSSSTKRQRGKGKTSFSLLFFKTNFRKVGPVQNWNQIGSGTKSEPDE